MKRRKKLFLLALLALLLILLAAVGVIFSNAFLKAARYGEAALEELAHDFNDPPSLGDLVNLEVKCVLPWGQSAEPMLFLPNEGFVQQGDLQIRHDKTSLDHRSKIITVPVRSYRTGKLAPGKLEIPLERPFYQKGTRKTTLSLELKKLDIAPLATPDRDQLPLADELQKAPAVNRKHLYLIGTLLALTAAGVIVSLLLKKRRPAQQKPLQPWEAARRDLDELRRIADNGKQPLQWCIARLTDVVRSYLSSRFDLPVKQQTTVEFFASLKRGKSPLTHRQTVYLEEFLNAADLIKFANIRPDQTLFDQAVNRAEELIDETALLNDNAASAVGEETV